MMHNIRLQKIKKNDIYHLFQLIHSAGSNLHLKLSERTSVVNLK